MGFLNPVFLFGMLAAAVPLLIHLWSRRQAKTVDFSSLMFLLVAHRQNVRRIQLKNLLILILRMLIIILIALALARPLLKNQFSFAGARAKTSAVIVLDNSYSMAYEGVQGQRFDKAKEMALEVAQSLRRGDSAAVILMSDIPDAIFRKLTTDLEQVKAALRNT
ncbi:MAG: BatA domain-containing protein, partial [Candidatus Poribacteria bacterium]|nr:BatA domain-containing protein [Candidatus Poribacteria bacterium]